MTITLLETSKEAGEATIKMQTQTKWNKAIRKVIDVHKERFENI